MFFSAAHARRDEIKTSSMWGMRKLTFVMDENLDVGDTLKLLLDAFAKDL